jgi:hypothetical protein
MSLAVHLEFKTKCVRLRLPAAGHRHYAVDRSTNTNHHALKECPVGTPEAHPAPRVLYP